MLDQDEIFKLNEDIEFKGWGAKHISETENDFELLTIFQRFCYRNGRLPLTIGLLVVPDGEVPERIEKINLKKLHEMCRVTNSHGLVCVQFICALRVFFRVNIEIIKNTM